VKIEFSYSLREKTGPASLSGGRPSGYLCGE
jgi:hypothetical protein